MAAQIMRQTANFRGITKLVFPALVMHEMYVTEVRDG
jgi:hypothetical protein